MIDDGAALPAHVRRSARACLGVAGAGVALWAIAMGGLVAVFGAGRALTDMGTFFSQAALLSFGGAYAVVPYVFEGAVTRHGWLTAAQMMDGLALGESTPGPLIMVVAFVGYLGGHGLDGATHPALAGVMGALVATFFTFLPSFVFILAGAPLVERTRGLSAISAPLTAISAAVVGVIAGLALVLARHVLWPPGLDGRFDVAAAALTVAAALALMRWRRPVPEVIGLSALAGLLVHALRA